MLYKSYSDMAACINANLWKIPHDIDGVIGIARSGMIPAAMIAEALNVGLTERLFFMDIVNSGIDVQHAFNSHGWRPFNNLKNSVFGGGARRKFIVVDDTCCNGRETQNSKTMFSEPQFSDFEFVYCVVYVDGPCGITRPDIVLEDLSHWHNQDHLFEWHVMTHPGHVKQTVFDLDGIMCLDPPDERNTAAYEAYLDNPTPFHVPSTSQPITIVTYRLEKYRSQTEKFLDSIGVTDRNLVMYPSNSYEQRAMESPWNYKAVWYRNHDEYKLFVESDEWQATMIYQSTWKDVYCLTTNKMFSRELETQ